MNESMDMSWMAAPGIEVKASKEETAVPEVKLMSIEELAKVRGINTKPAEIKSDLPLSLVLEVNAPKVSEVARTVECPCPPDSIVDSLIAELPVQFTLKERASSVRAAIYAADKEHEKAQTKRKQELYTLEPRPYVRIKDDEIVRAVRAVLSAVEQGVKPNVSAAFRGEMGTRAGKIALDSTRLPAGTGRKVLSMLRGHFVVKTICTSTDSACGESAYMLLQVLTMRQLVSGIIRLYKSAKEHQMLVDKVTTLEEELQAMKLQLAALTAAPVKAVRVSSVRADKDVSVLVAQAKALSEEGLSVRAIADKLGIGKSSAAKYIKM